jgi:hypothetical protein
VVVDSVAGTHGLANRATDRGRCLAGVSVFAVRDQIAVRVRERLLRGHKIHSQDQKETKRYNFEFSQGKFHFCDLILVWGMLRLSNRDEQMKPRWIGVFFVTLKI